MPHFIDLIGFTIPLRVDLLEKVKPYIKERKLRKNDFLLQADGICRKASFIRQGACYMYRNKDGKEEVTDFHFAGMLSGDYVSFIKQEPAEHSIKALEDCEVEEISHVDLQYLYKAYPKLERAGRILSEDVYCRVLTRMTSYQNDNPELRYQQLKQQNPDLFDRLPQYLIAAYLGVTPVGLSKIRRRLNETGAFIKPV